MSLPAQASPQKLVNPLKRVSRPRINQQTHKANTMQHHDIEFEIKEVTNSGTFMGYGSVYGVVDLGDDIVASGAFTKSLSDLSRKGLMPAMLWQHRAAEPIGVYTSVKEDPNGLFVEGKLALKTQRGAEAYELMQMKAISGLSIGFVTKDADFNNKNGTRTIKSADLHEISLVTFPMNDSARVSSVKNISEIGDLTSAENYLRDAGGLSRREAKAFISTLKALNLRDAGEDNSEELKAIALLLEKQRAIFA
jgi:HK97 family phage prohead protease